MQICKTVGQTIRGETAQLVFVRPKSPFLGGLGGPQISFALKSSYFCELGAHAKNLNPTTPPYAILATVVR